MKFVTGLMFSLLAVCLTIPQLAVAKPADCKNSVNYSYKTLGSSDYICSRGTIVIKDLPKSKGYDAGKCLTINYLIPGNQMLSGVIAISALGVKGPVFKNGAVSQEFSDLQAPQGSIALRFGTGADDGQYIELENTSIGTLKIQVLKCT